MSGLLDNNYLDPEVQAKRIAQQKREAIIRALHSADDARGVPRRNLSEEEIQQYLMTRQPLQDYVESASENPYMGGNLTPQDLWKSQAHSMSPDYLSQNNMAEEHGLCTMCREKPAKYEPYYAKSEDNYLCEEWDQPN